MPIGSVWGTGTWADTAWAEGSWADAVAPVGRTVPDGGGRGNKYRRRGKPVIVGDRRFDPDDTYGISRALAEFLNPPAPANPPAKRGRKREAPPPVIIIRTDAGPLDIPIVPRADTAQLEEALDALNAAHADMKKWREAMQDEEEVEMLLMAL